MSRNWLVIGLFCVAPVRAQQPVCVSGLLEPVPGVTICQQGETHWFPEAGIYLRSNSVNWTPFVGRVVTVTGFAIGLTCELLDVIQITDPAPTLLVQCGSPMLGCPVKVVVSGPGMGLAFLAASTSSGIIPFGCLSVNGLEGSLLLGLPAVILSSGVTGTGIFDLTFTIPSNNSLIGIGVWLQGAHATIGPVGPLVLTNVQQFVTTPLLPPCAPTNC